MLDSNHAWHTAHWSTTPTSLDSWRPPLVDFGLSLTGEDILVPLDFKGNYVIYDFEDILVIYEFKSSLAIYD